MSEMSMAGTSPTVPGAASESLAKCWYASNEMLSRSLGLGPAGPADSAFPFFFAFFPLLVPESENRSSSSSSFIFLFII